MSLPEYWVVKRSNHPRWGEVIDYINNKYMKPIGEHYGGSIDMYYGYDGNIDYNGSCSGDYLTKFKNNPVVLTVDEFFKCLENSSTDNYDIF